jgi:hypothetical protein
MQSARLRHSILARRHSLGRRFLQLPTPPALLLARLPPPWSLHHERAQSRGPTMDSRSLLAALGRARAGPSVAGASTWVAATCLAGLC